LPLALRGYLMQLPFVLLLTTALLYGTLPSAILLWTEPDMDPAFHDFDWQRDYLIAGPMSTAQYLPSRNNWGPLLVPEGKYFVLGDNRDNSLDSRYWGFVADSLVKGRPFVVYYSYSPDSVDTFAWLTHIRWTRLGERIH